MHTRLARVVHLHLTGTRTATHTNILNGTAEAGGFMPFEVVERNKYIGIHNRSTDFCLLDVLAALDRHIYFIRAL